MTETKANRNGERGLSRLIRKEIGSDTNRRFLARMPAFRAVADLPDNLRALLGDLDHAEAKLRQPGK